jgi:Phage Terminase
MNILEAMDDPRLFGKAFKRGLLRDSYRAWRVFLAALWGLKLDAEALEIYRKHTGRDDLPTEQFSEAYAIVGRRGGKSTVAALIAVFISCLKDYSQILSPGERGVFMLLAGDRRQARVIFAYVNALLESSPVLKNMVVGEPLKEAVNLRNGIDIEIYSSNFKSVRGRTIVGCCADEIAFWPSDDSANPDTETLNALRPGMATVPGALLLAISSPYSRRGALFEAFRDHYGKPSDVLVWKASSREMNPGLSRAVVAAAYVRDRAAADAEYGGNFRSDLETFIDEELIRQSIITGRKSLPYIEKFRYYAFVDVSGGRSDSATLAIAHTEGRRAVHDLVREIAAPHSPERVVEEFVSILKAYHLSSVTGDKYAANWTSEAFERRGVRYTSSEKNRSQIYLEFLPLLTSGAVDLLDHDRMKTQFIGLERRTGRAADIIDHGAGGRDDVANSVAGSCIAAASSSLFLGQVEYIKKLERGERTLPQQVPARRVEAPQAPGACEKCGATCVVRIGAMLRCNQCGHQDDSKVQRVQQPSRRDAQSDWTSKVWR